nr:hypothetical protein [uncultured archaeon]
MTCPVLKEIVEKCEEEHPDLNIEVVSPSESEKVSGGTTGSYTSNSDEIAVTDPFDYFFWVLNHEVVHYRRKDKLTMRVHQSRKKWYLLLVASVASGFFGLFFSLQWAYGAVALIISILLFFRACSWWEEKRADEDKGIEIDRIVKEVSEECSE